MDRVSNYPGWGTNWEVDHLVAWSDSKVFIVAKQQDDRELIFLVDTSTATVYIRYEDSWERLYGTESRAVIARFIAARNQHIPTFPISTHNSTLQAILA